MYWTVNRKHKSSQIAITMLDAHANENEQIKTEKLKTKEKKNSKNKTEEYLAKNR